MTAEHDAADDERPLSWLPDLALELTPKQRLELAQLLDFAWAAVHADESCAYTKLELGDVDVAHRALHLMTQQPRRKSRKKGIKRGDV